jgi:hypothetical protein
MPSRCRQVLGMDVDHVVERRQHEVGELPVGSDSIDAGLPDPRSEIPPPRS